MGTRGGIARNADANADAVGDSRACELRDTKHVLQATRVIAVTVFSTKQGYPKPLHRIHSKDLKTGRKRVVITNHPNDLAPLAQVEFLFGGLGSISANRFSALRKSLS